MNESKPKRRWYQCRLRTLHVATLLLALFFAWIGSGLQQARRNREALAEVYEVVGKADGVVHAESVKPPDSLGILLGDPGVRRVVYVRAPHEFDDSALEIIGGLPSLRELHLGGTQVTDAGLVHLNGLTKLEELYLNGTKVTDAGLVHLKGLTNLTSLNLDSTQVTDAGLAHLRELTSLRHLDLRHTNVTFEAVIELSKALPNCRIAIFST